MQCFYAAETEAHNPKFRLTLGQPRDNAEQPRRAALLLAGLEELGLSVEAPPEAPRDALTAVHSERFVRFLETAWERWSALPGAGPEVVANAFPDRALASYPEFILAQAGWHMGDTSAPIGAGSWTATRRAADCAVAAAQTVLEGARASYALTRPPGHHTSGEVAAGHCLMNVSAIAAAHLRRQLSRVAILDIDVHHGNGTQAIFYDRDDVLFVSLHADPADYYPFFTGHAHETGRGAGAGFNLNLPLPRSSGDAEWLAALEIGLARIADYAPEALVVSLGLDAHENDPLAGMQVTWDGFKKAGARIAQADLPTVFIQEGGYLSDDLSQSLVSFFTGVLKT